MSPWRSTKHNSILNSLQSPTMKKNLFGFLQHFQNFLDYKRSFGYETPKFSTRQGLGKGRIWGKEHGHDLELKDLGLTHIK